MPFKPEYTKMKGAFERSTVFEEVVTKIDDACLLRTMNQDGDGDAILCTYRVDKLPKAMIEELVKIYDEYGWVLEINIPHSMRGGQDPMGFLLTEKI